MSTTTINENAKRIREIDENVITSPLRKASINNNDQLPAKRMKDDSAQHLPLSQQNGNTSCSDQLVKRAAQPVVVVPQLRPNVPRSTVGKVFHVLSNDELHAILDNNDGDEKLRDTSILFLAHAQWSQEKIQHVVDDIHLHSNVSAVAIYTVDVDDVDEAGEALHIESFPLPVAILFHFDHDGNGAKIAEKKVSMPVHVHALSLVNPIHSIDHLQQRMAAALAADGPSSYTVVYYGASWCPPCMRILQHLPEMLPQLPNTISQFVKADKDTVQPLFDMMGVQKIPTFQVLKNSVANDVVGGEWKPEAVDSLQNSNPVNVASFIERHCAVLTFTMDDDF